MRTNKVSRLSSKSLAPKWPVLIGSIALAAALLSTCGILQAAPQSSSANDLSQQIFDTMLKIYGTQARTWPVDAKGLVCDATFTPPHPAAHFHDAKRPSPSASRTATPILSSALVFEPTLLTDGMDLSNDPLATLRSLVYAHSAMHR
jgi:hypothetical protein